MAERRRRAIRARGRYLGETMELILPDTAPQKNQGQIAGPGFCPVCFHLTQ
jgi:hypothetical protein